MGTPALVAWGLTTICLGLIALAQCIPVEIVYTGEGCDCPSKLDYLVNIPKVPRPKKYTLGDYGYKVEVPTPPPVQVKEKVSYSFDFIVEEPRTPKPEKSSRWNLYAKVDRIAINKGDCENDYAPPTPPPCSRCGYSCNCGKSCGCGQATRPIYRYVYKKVLPPYKCQRGNCKYNLVKRTLSPNSIESTNFVRFLPSTSVPFTSLESGGSGGSIRRKRDLHHLFFRPRKSQLRQRPSRYIKHYHKTLPRKRHATLFDFDFDLDNFVAPPMVKKSQRKVKKMLLPQHARIVKRDIQGEFELLEKEREQMDLTLPEIIQYMPETLQPDFKRGQCYFGCANQQPPVSSSTFNYSGIQETLDQPSQTNQEPTSKSENTKDTQKQQQEALPKNNDNPSQNVITSSYTKRNAANYNFGTSATKLPSFLPAQSAYGAQLPPSPPSHISTNPIYDSQQQAAAAAPQSDYSAATKIAEPLRSVYDRLGHKFIERNGRLRLIVPDPIGDADSLPLQYAGDLEKAPHIYRSPTHKETPITSSRNYPVQHISTEHLDRIISEIVYRHPDFIDASAHYGSELVDPEPWQEQETKHFLKKLIDGRLSIWFGGGGSQDHDDNPYYTSSYSNPFNPYLVPPPPPVIGFYPSVY